MKPAADSKFLFWFLLALFSCTTFALWLMDSSIRSADVPYGIVSFEFCGFAQSCDAILESWGVSGKNVALVILGMDYLYLVVYPALIASSLFLLRSKLPLPYRRINTTAIYLCVVIAVADAVENYGLIQIILRGESGSYGVLSSIFASVKFAVLGFTLCCLIFASGKVALTRTPDRW